MSEIDDSAVTFDDEPMDTIEEIDLTEGESVPIESQDLFDSLPQAIGSKSSKPPIATSLPLARVKRICKLDSKVKNITLDAVKLISFCTEHFVECLVQASVVHTKEDGRKTCQMKDFQRAIRRSWLFYMLDEALEDWPEPGKAGGSDDEEGRVEEDEIIVLDDNVTAVVEETTDSSETMEIEVADNAENDENTVTIDEQLTPKKVPPPLRDIEDL